MNEMAGTFCLRPIAAADDAAMAALIRTVMPEFGASGPGFASEDPEVDWISRAYAGERARFYVVEQNGRIVGGGGFGPLRGAEPTVCELRKMYFYPEVRGFGMGKRLLLRILDDAKAVGYETCYLETLDGMDRAAKLYAALGFKKLSAPLGETGHCGCNRWMAKAL